MKKNVKKEVENIVYKSDNISLCRINNLLHLYGQHDFTLNEIFEIIVWGTKNRDEDFWNLKLTLTDKQNAQPLNIIYWLTGGDKIWKGNNWIWKDNWNGVSNILLEYFSDKIMKMVNSSKTIGDLRNSILAKLSCEDFYEVGIMQGMINDDETLL